MVAALLCLLVVSLIVGAMLSSLSIELRGTRSRQRQLQATWLARSATERAEAKLLANPTFTGETWLISAADLGRPNGGHEGKVVIEVVPGENPEQRRITVDATYPVDAPRQARCVRTTAALISQHASEKSEEMLAG